MCFKAANGSFLWQVTHPRLSHFQQDLPMMAITSQPCIDEERIYYISNRGELMCLSLDGGIIWKLDMVHELGVYKRDETGVGNPISSPLVVGELVYSVTGNGSDTDRIPRPEAPSFLAVNKKSGKVVWSSNAPGKNIIYGQWSSPVFTRVNGRSQVVFPGGDGFLYGYEPLTGKLLWKTDCGGPNPAEADPKRFDKRNYFVATPTVDNGMVYIGLTQAWEQPLQIRRPLLAIELLAREATIQSQVKWSFDHKDFDGTFGSAAVAKGKVFVVSRSGTLFALNAKSGVELWRCNLGTDAAIHSSPYVKDDQLYVPTADNELIVFSLSENPKCIGRYYFGIGHALQSTPIFDRDRLYVAASGYLWALKLPQSLKE